MRGLGETGLQTGPVGLSSTFGKNPKDVEWAFALGCNYLVLKSKRQAGFMSALRHVAKTNRDKLVLALEATPSCSLTMRLSLELTLRRLGVRHLDVLLLGHRPGTDIDKLFETATRLKEQGKVRFLGLVLPRRHKSRLPMHRLGSAVSVIHAPCNAATPEMHLSLIRPEGEPSPAIVGTYATSNGALLRSRPGLGRPPTVSDCYRFALAQPGISLCLAGSPHPSDLRSALGSLDLGPLSPDQLAWMLAAGAASQSITHKPLAPRNLRPQTVPVRA